MKEIMKVFIVCFRQNCCDGMKFVMGLDGTPDDSSCEELVSMKKLTTQSECSNGEAIEYGFTFKTLCPAMCIKEEAGSPAPTGPPGAPWSIGKTGDPGAPGADGKAGWTARRSWYSWYSWQDWAAGPTSATRVARLSRTDRQY